jgi:hypothetical protein
LSAGVLSAPWRVSNRVPWSEPINLWAPVKGVVDPNPPIAAELSLKAPQGSVGQAPFVASTGNGYLTIVGSTINILVPANVMQGLQAGRYPFDLYLTYPMSLVVWKATGIVEIVATNP